MRALLWLATLLLLSLGGGGPVAGDDAPGDRQQQAEAEQQSELRTRPVLLIPGFASSQLHAWSRVSCDHSIQKNLYRDVNIGDRACVYDVGVLVRMERYGGADDVRCRALDRRGAHLGAERLLGALHEAARRQPERSRVQAAVRVLLEPSRMLRLLTD